MSRHIALWQNWAREKLRPLLTLRLSCAGNPSFVFLLSRVASIKNCRLLSKSWNNGAHKFRLFKLNEAEKWMSLAFKFLQHSPEAKMECEQQMVAAYSHLLEKLAEHQCAPEQAAQ